MSPRQLKALEPALTSLEGYVQTADDDYIASTGRASVEDLRDFADEFRAAVGGDAPEESASAAREDGLPSWASGANELPMGGLRGPEGQAAWDPEFHSACLCPKPRQHLV